jgi:negative regulator of sigma E activity
MIAGKPAVHLSVVGAEGKTVDAVHRYEVWFDKQSGLPTKVVSYGLDGKLLETVMMEAMSINVRFPPDFRTLTETSAMADYQFSTVWRVEASVQEVWEILSS